MKQKFRPVLTVLLLVILVLLMLAKGISNLYINWLWFCSLHFQQVFSTILFTELGMRVGTGLLFFMLIFTNLMFTRRHLLKAIGAHFSRQEEGGNIVTLYQSPWAKYIGPRFLMGVFLVFSLVLSLLMSFTVSGNWLVLQKYLHPTAFGQVDPVFGKDIGFYVFELPFYLFIYRFLTWATFFIAFLIFLIYFLIDFSKKGLSNLLKTNASRYHLSILAFIFFLIKAWGYRLDQYMLLYSQEGIVYGPGYTDIHAHLLAYRILLVIALVCAAAILINMLMRRFKLVLGSIGFLIAVSLLMGSVYPVIIQKLIVAPNEYDMEKPYIERSIAFTRQAYDLNNISPVSFPAGVKLTSADAASDQDVIGNIRLWDSVPLQETYNQIQTMRLYYNFPQISVDRYYIDGQYKQVMLGVREMDQSQLPDQAKTWVNERLKYTHGYGVAMSPVNEFTSDGLPLFYIENIPPETKTGIRITTPQIYYGEDTSNYVIVDTKTAEFDYPMGQDNEYCTYQGSGGVKINSFWRRLTFAFSFADYKLLLSSDITDQSRVLYYRNIKELVPKIAPFLQYDGNPYPVISGGKIYWMWDAYTVTSMYPYSEPYSGSYDYIRNSVKVVVDAYNGDVTYYISDPTDPIIQTYAKIFPGLFLPMDQMPAGLKAHIRYPVDYFMTQARMYATYHMTDPEVFYNKEDKWSMATDIESKQEKTMQPYYIITKLPGATKPEYVLMLPFTPQNKTNMVAWLAARMDPPNYGKLNVYLLPKQELVYGPMQIEALIDQNTTISQQLTLWNQQGSQVIRGNLMIIPIRKAILYVEPLYLQADQSKMPELSQVIVIQDNRVAMQPTLGAALAQLLGSPPQSQQAQGSTNVQQDDTVGQLIENANQLFTSAQKELQAGNWAGYGEDMRKLDETLKDLEDKVNPQSSSQSSSQDNSQSSPQSVSGTT